MKHLLFMAAISLLTANAQAQNTGIGTTTPQATLDVKGNQRIGGVNKFMTFDSASGKIEWRSANLYVPVSQYLMQHSAAQDGLYYNNNAPISGQLEYRNASGNPVFYTNFINGNGYFAGNVGIGAATPPFPLSFGTALGDKISIWSNSTNSYGFGIQSSLLQIHTDISAADIAFGYGSSASFVETMRIKGNGNAGIGTANPGARLHVVSGASGYAGANFPGITLEGNSNTYFNILSPNGNETAILFGKASDAASGGIVYNNAAHLNGMEFRTNGNTTRMILLDNGSLGVGVSDPAYQLDISNRMRIRSGGNNSVSAGLWLNNNANTEAAFIGMEDDTHVGLFGNGGAGWKFSMNTQTGALKINGTEGAAGQILTSNGAGTPASWINPSVKPYAFTIKPTQFTTLSGVQLSVLITGLDNVALNLNQNSTVLYTVTAPISGNGPGTIDSKGYLVVEIVDGGGRVSYASSDYYIKRSTTTSQTASGVAVNLPAGSYTIKASLARLSPGDGDADTHGSLNSNQQGIQLIVQVLPN